MSTFFGWNVEDHLITQKDYILFVYKFEGISTNRISMAMRWKSKRRNWHKRMAVDFYNIGMRKLILRLRKRLKSFFGKSTTLDYELRQNTASLCGRAKSAHRGYKKVTMFWDFVMFLKNPLWTFHPSGYLAVPFLKF